jgi:outer membrane protein assembly factor BamA
LRASVRSRPNVLVLLLLGLVTTLPACKHAPPAGSRDQVVTAIEVHGLKAVKPADLLAKLGTEKQPWYPFAAPRYFSPFVFRKDQERILAFLHERGFFNAQVTDTQVVELDAAKKKLKLIIVIEEGPAAIVSGRDIKGLQALPPSVLARVLKEFPLKVGDRFDYTLYRRGETRLLGRLRRLGYALTKVETNAVISPDRTRAELTYDVQLGPLCNLGGVTIRGLSRVPERLVREKITFDRGDPFDPEKLELTRGKIFELGVFSVVKLTEVPRPGVPGIIDVDIEVKETLFRNLKLGVGIGIDSAREEAHVQVVWRHNNFLGGLRRFETGAKVGYAVLPTVFTVQAHGPLLKAYGELSQPSAFLWRNLTWKTRLEYELNIQNGYRYHGPRFRTGFDRPFTRYLTVAISYNSEFTSFYDVDPILFDPRTTSLGLDFQNPYILGYLEQRLTVDLRDNPVKPRSGGYFNLTTQEANTYLGSNFTYFKVLGDARGYLTPQERLTLAARFQIGTAIPSGQSPPITQRFYGGGANDDRGFGYRRLSPLVPGSLPGQTIPIGGLTFVGYTVEARVRTIKDLFVVAFHDAGDVSECSRDVRFDHLRYQVGGGLRYLTPIGAIRLDVGVRLNQIGAMRTGNYCPGDDPAKLLARVPSQDARWAFQFSIGEAF